MAINIRVTNNDSFSNEVVYKRLADQTPLDLAVSYLENGLDDLFKFYSKFGMVSYEEFYNTDTYRITKEINPMVLNQFEAATRADASLYPPYTGRIYASGRFRIFGSGINDVRIYK